MPLRLSGLYVGNTDLMASAPVAVPLLPACLLQPASRSPPATAAAPSPTRPRNVLRVGSTTNLTRVELVGLDDKQTRGDVQAPDCWHDEQADPMPLLRGSSGENEGFDRYFPEGAASAKREGARHSLDDDAERAAAGRLCRRAGDQPRGGAA